MASDSEDVSVVETSLEIPEFDTQFIPQEDDDDTLWEVIEILAERGNRYKVKWAGDDPQTGKPWAPSWVAKHDCTDKLIHEWKLKQAKKKKKKDSPKKDSSSRARSLASSSRTTKRSTDNNQGSENGEIIVPRKKQKVMMDVIVPSVKHKGRQEALEDNCIEDQVQSPPREVIKIGPPRGVKRKRQTASERVRLKASSSLPSKETAQGEIEHAVTCTPNESQQHDEGHAWLFLRSPSPVLHSPSGAQQAMGEVETINPNLTLPDLPPTTSTQQADMDSQSQDHSNSDPNIRNLMHALEEKSIEVEAFGRQTLELQLEVTNLKAENVKLSAMSLAADTRYQDQTRALVDAEAHCNSLQQQIADLCRGQAEERLALESSLEKQHTMVRTLQTGKEDAERAQELFREYYNKASAHVTEVDAKNAELEHQLILKSGQVDDGLAMVKEVYEEQLRKTQEELDKWKAFCKVLAEKDRRTDDEVRKRAALEPELRGENERLKQEMDSLRMAYGRFAALQQTTKDYGNGCTQPVSSQDSEEYSQVENGADIIYYVCQFVHGTSICHARFITVEEVREHALHTHFYEVTSEPGYMA